MFQASASGISPAVSAETMASANRPPLYSLSTQPSRPSTPEKFAARACDKAVSNAMRACNCTKSSWSKAANASKSVSAPLSVAMSVFALSTKVRSISLSCRPNSASPSAIRAFKSLHACNRRYSVSVTYTNEPCCGDKLPDMSAAGCRLRNMASAVWK